MAKKKAVAKKKPTTKARGKKGPWDFEELGGMAAGVYASPMIDGAIPATMNLDPKMVAGGKIFVGHMLAKGKFGGGGSFMSGAGLSLQVMGIQSMMREFGLIQGDDDDLVVAIDGTDDEDPDDVSGDDDIDTINEDVLGEDDDIDTVNEDVLGDDEDDEM